VEARLANLARLHIKCSTPRAFQGGVITAAAVDAPGDVEVLQTRAWARSMREKKGSLPVAESEPGHLGGRRRGTSTTGGCGQQVGNRTRKEGEEDKVQEERVVTKEATDSSAWPEDDEVGRD
jgi:hypothetical protein